VTQDKEVSDEGFSFTILNVDSLAEIGRGGLEYIHIDRHLLLTFLFTWVVGVRFPKVEAQTARHSSPSLLCEEGAVMQQLGGQQDSKRLADRPLLMKASAWNRCGQCYRRELVLLNYGL